MKKIKQLTIYVMVVIVSWALFSISCTKKANDFSPNARSQPQSSSTIEAPNLKYRESPQPELVQGTEKDSVYDLVLSDPRAQSLISLMDETYGVTPSESSSVVIRDNSKTVAYISLHSDSLYQSHYVYWDSSIEDTIYAFTWIMTEDSLQLSETFGAFVNAENAIQIQEGPGIEPLNHKTECIKHWCIACEIGCLGTNSAYIECVVGCCGAMVLFCLVGWL